MRRKRRHLRLLGFAAGLPAGQAGRRGVPKETGQGLRAPRMRPRVSRTPSYSRTLVPRAQRRRAIPPRRDSSRAVKGELAGRAQPPCGRGAEGRPSRGRRTWSACVTATRCFTEPPGGRAPVPGGTRSPHSPPDRLAPGAAESLAAPAAAFASPWLRCVGFGESGTDPARSPHGAGDCQGHLPPDPGQEQVSAPCPFLAPRQKKKVGFHGLN